MKTVPLGQLTTLVSSGSTPKGGSKIYLDSGPVMLIRSQNVLMRHLSLDDVAFITDDIASEMKRTVVHPGDVLLNITGASIGRVAVFDLEATKANVNQHVCIIRPKVDQLSHRYLMHFIARPHFQERINSTQNGGTRQALNFSQIRDFQIPLPPLHEQRRIAAILDKAAAIRRKRQEALALTNKFLRSAFLEMFGDPVTNPKGWPVVKLEETLSLKPQIGTIVPAQEVGQQIVVRVGELGDYNVALERSKRVTLQGSELKRFELIPGDFLLARAIGSEEHLGKASVLQPVDQTVVFDSHVMRLRFKEKYLDPMFFLQWLRTEGGRALFMRRAGRTAVQFNINARQISDIDIPLPEFSFQKEFRELFTRVRCLHQKHYQSFQFEESLFNSLTQRAFRGEL